MAGRMTKLGALIKSDPNSAREVILDYARKHGGRRYRMADAMQRDGICGHYATLRRAIVRLGLDEQIEQIELDASLAGDGPENNDGVSYGR